MGKGKIYLIPSTLAEETAALIPQGVRDIANGLTLFFVEHERTARRFLKSIGYADLNAPDLQRLDKRSEDVEVEQMITLVERGQDAGILSEAGSPGIADPGAKLVALAHSRGVQVVPLPGPSSILLAVMGSGLSGQDFAFNGYLPVDDRLRTQALRDLETKANKTGQTQVFMETPYRNNKMLQAIFSACHADTHLCIAANLTAHNEFIQTKKIKGWAKHPPHLDKVPAVFLFGRLS
jgi:16S rRNA (cytidine1402-2'-O)-methyltransferase